MTTEKGGERTALKNADDETIPLAKTNSMSRAYFLSQLPNTNIVFFSWTWRRLRTHSLPLPAFQLKNARTPAARIEEEEEEEEEEEGRRRRRRHEKVMLYSYHRHHGQQPGDLDAASRKSGGKSVGRIAESTLGTFHLVQVGLRFGVSSVGAPGTEGTKSAMVPARLENCTRRTRRRETLAENSNGRFATITGSHRLRRGRIHRWEKRVAMVYSTFLTMLLALVMQCRMMLSPIAFVLTIVAPVDLGGLW